ncbi:response regulator [Candidatus Nitrospira bockiana]
MDEQQVVNPTQSPRILLVDDDPLLLAPLADMLTWKLPEAAVVTCLSAMEALQRVEEADVDVIVSDIKMPKIDGFELLERVKARHPAVPVLLMSGHGDHDLAVKAVTGGAYAFIVKPIDRDYFLAWLKRAIRERRLNEEVQFKNRALELYARDLEQMVEEHTAALRESEERFRAVLDHAPMAIYIKGLDGRYLFVNREAESIWRQLTGCSPVGKTDADLLPPETARMVEANDRAAVRARAAIRVEESVGAAPARTYFSVKFPLLKKDGTVYAVCGISHEVTQ